MKSLEQRLEEKYIPEPNTGCWLWEGSAGPKNYGVMRIDGKAQRAHRVSYSLYFGKIPEGKQVLHRCDTPCCVNPEHLFLGTNADNMADRDAKCRMAKGERHGMAKITERQARAIYTESGTYKEIGSRYGISGDAVGLIKRRKKWVHIHE